MAAHESQAGLVEGAFDEDAVSRAGFSAEVGFFNLLKKHGSGIGFGDALFGSPEDDAELGCAFNHENARKDGANFEFGVGVVFGWEVSRNPEGVVTEDEFPDDVVFSG